MAADKNNIVPLPPRPRAAETGPAPPFPREVIEPYAALIGAFGNRDWDLALSLIAELADAVAAARDAQPEP